MNKNIIAAGLGVLLLGYFIVNHFVASAAEDRIDTLVAEVNQEGGAETKFSYDDVSASSFGSEIIISDIHIKDTDDHSIVQIETLELEDLDKDGEFPGSIIANNIQLDDNDDKNSESINIGAIRLDGLPTSRDSEFPEHLTLSIEDFVLTLPEQKNRSASENQYLEKIIALNSGAEDALLIDTEINIDYDAENQTIEAKTNYNMDELFSLNMRLKMQGVALKKDVFRVVERNFGAGKKADFGQLLVNAEMASLGDAEIEFNNQGVVELVWAQMAKEQDIDIKQFKQNLLTELETNSKAIAGAGPNILASIDELKEFIDDPESLSISVAPDEAMLLTEMMMAALRSPEDFLGQLNIRIEAN